MKNISNLMAGAGLDYKYFNEVLKNAVAQGVAFAVGVILVNKSGDPFVIAIGSCMAIFAFLLFVLGFKQIFEKIDGALKPWMSKSKPNKWLGALLGIFFTLFCSSIQIGVFTIGVVDALKKFST